MDMEEARRNDIWYEHTHLYSMKRTAMNVAQEAMKYGLGSVLTNTYGKSCDRTQTAIDAWARNGNNRRGLERWVNNEYAAKRSDIRRRTIKSVLRAQRKMREEGVDEPEYAGKVLSRLSEAFSQDARNFARVLGRADEHAVLVDSATTEKVENSKDVRKTPLRQASPTSVTFTQFAHRPPRRNLRLSAAPAIDLRHFY